MSLTQGIILYFFIIPILSFIIYAVIESYLEDKKVTRIKNMELIRRNKILNRKLNYIKYKKINKIQFLNCMIK